MHTGQIKDRYINIYDYGARRYDQNLGRFLSPDTIIPQLSDPQQLNRYTYAANNPLRYTDPTGHYIDEGSGTEDEDYDFYDPESAQSAYGSGTAQRVSYATAQRHAPPKSDFELFAAATIPAWGGAAVLGLAGVAETGASLVGTGVKKAAEGIGALLCGDGDCGNEARAGIDWLENNMSKVKHIMKGKHAWDLLVTDLGDDVLENYRKVQPYLEQTLNADPAGTLVRMTKLGPSMMHTALIEGQTVMGQFVHLSHNAFKIVDGWVKTMQ